MKKILQEFHEIEEKIQQIGFSREYQKLLTLLDVIPQIEEYCRFIKALILCREVAYEDYAYVCGELDKLNGISDKVQKLQTHFNEIQINDTSWLSPDVPTQKLSADKLRETISSFSLQLSDAVKSIRQKNEQSKQELSKFKIVLFGKTKAGKSTIREALTKGNGATIGRGSQSTTLEIHEYSWANLKVYDTPGSLSVRDKNKDKCGIGDEEREAHKLLQDSDIAVFMFTSDNIETAELEYLKEIQKKGKDILVLLNVKADISNYTLFKRRKKEREISAEYQKGNFERITKEIPGYSPTILPIHAQAAFFSRGRNSMLDEFYQKNSVRRNELYQISHFREVRNYLVQNILERGKTMRTKTIRGKFISVVREFAQKNQKPIDCCLNEAQRIYDLLRKEKARIERKIKAFDERILADVQLEARSRIDTYDIAYECIDEKYSKSEIQERWQNVLTSELSDIPEAVIEPFLDEIKDDIASLLEQINFIEQNTSFEGMEAYSAPWKDLLRGGSLVAGLVGFAATVGWIPGGGWVIGGAAALGAIFLAIAGLFKSKETKIRELQEKFDSSLQDAVDDLEKQIRNYCAEKIYPEIREKIDEIISTQQTLIKISQEFGKLNQLFFDNANENEKKLKKRILELEAQS